MPVARPPLETLRKAVELVSQYGGVSQASKAADIPGTTLERHYRWGMAAAQRGEFGFDPIMPGFQVSRVTTGKDGKPVSIQQKPQAGEPFQIPAGHRVKGVSALIDPQGRELAKWVKTREDQLSDEALIETLREAFIGFKSPYVPVAPDRTEADSLTIYSIVDWHIGLLAWAEETGENYDLKIAEKVIMASMSKLIGASPASKQCVILGLGDLLHFDGYEPVTSRSGNFLDVDGRYPKVLKKAAEMVLATIDMALAKHKNVLVRMLPGNHDDRATVAINLALALRYEGHKRVTVDDSPSRFWWYRFGKNFFGATHGDKTKMGDLPLVMASDRPQDWAASTYRRIYTGHLHHERRIEEGGVVVTCMRTPVAKDAYHSFERYRAGRSVYSETYRADGSEAATLQFNL